MTVSVPSTSVLPARPGSATGRSGAAPPGSARGSDGTNGGACGRTASDGPRAVTESAWARAKHAVLILFALGRRRPGARKRDGARGSPVNKELAGGPCGPPVPHHLQKARACGDEALVNQTVQLPGRPVDLGERDVVQVDRVCARPGPSPSAAPHQAQPIRPIGVPSSFSVCLPADLSRSRR